jgi:hypothetical protein
MWVRFPPGTELRDFFESETHWEYARSEASIDSLASAHLPCELPSMSLDFPRGENQPEFRRICLQLSGILYSLLSAIHYNLLSFR